PGGRAALGGLDRLVSTALTSSATVVRPLITSSARYVSKRCASASLTSRTESESMPKSSRRRALSTTRLGSVPTTCCAISASAARICVVLGTPSLYWSGVWCAGLHGLVRVGSRKFLPASGHPARQHRSEERRVGKEYRSLRSKATRYTR